MRLALKYHSETPCRMISCRPMKSDETIWDVVHMVADDVGINRERIRLWRFRGKVPYKWRLPIVDAAKKKNRRIEQRDFEPA